MSILSKQMIFLVPTAYAIIQGSDESLDPHIFYQNIFS